jgi:hypothetical protein
MIYNLEKEVNTIIGDIKEGSIKWELLVEI